MVIVKDCILVIVKEMVLSHALPTYEPFLVKKVFEIFKRNFLPTYCTVYLNVRPANYHISSYITGIVRQIIKLSHLIFRNGTLRCIMN